MEGHIGPNTLALHQRRVSPPVRPRQWSQRPTDRKQRNRAFVRLSSPWSEIYFQCKHYTGPQLSLMIVMWVKTHLKPDVSVQVEVIRIQPEILQQLWIVQVVWILSRHWKITEAHDLFGGVGHQGAVDAGLVRFCGLLRIEWESQGEPFFFSVFDPRYVCIIEWGPASGLLTTHLKLPEAADVIAAFEADGLQAFIDADFDTGQARASGSDHSHPSHHCWTKTRP